MLEDGRIEDLMVDDPEWYMKMDYGRHPRFNKKIRSLVGFTMREKLDYFFILLYWYMMEVRIIFNDVDHEKY